MPTPFPTPFPQVHLPCLSLSPKPLGHSVASVTYFLSPYLFSSCLLLWLSKYFLLEFESWLWIHLSQNSSTEVAEPRSGFTTKRSAQLIKSTEHRVEYKPILPILMFLKDNWLLKEKLVAWTETSEMGGHRGSWFYAPPHLDGTWTFRLCQQQMATSCSSSQNESYIELQPNN